MQEQDTQETLPTLPDWSTAPDWAMWFAIDKDGLGFWYESKPILNRFKCEWVRLDIRSKVGLIDKLFDTTNWQNSLQQRPQQ